MNKHSEKLSINFDYYFDNNLIGLFPERAHLGIKKNKEKYRFELDKIAKAFDSNKTLKIPKLMDVGCGFGVNLIMSKMLWEVEAVGLDRFDEFTDSYNREVGSRSIVIDRMKSMEISVKELNIVNDLFDFEPHKFDVISNFDVIEHFPFSPLNFLGKLFDSLELGGTLLVGTPNQVHLRNRIRCLFGMNTWEDFDYYLNAETFYGHVREFTPSELNFICKSICRDVSINYSTYPLNYSASTSKTVIGEIYYKFLIKLLEKIPKLNYYMIGVMVKN
jgi:SAM-dependent methyltransferase